MAEEDYMPQEKRKCWDLLPCMLTKIML